MYRVLIEIHGASKKTMAGNLCPAYGAVSSLPTDADAVGLVCQVEVGTRWGQEVETTHLHSVQSCRI